MLDCLTPSTQRVEQVHKNPIPARFDSQTFQKSGNRPSPQGLAQGGVWVTAAFNAVITAVRR